MKIRSAEKKIPGGVFSLIAQEHFPFRFTHTSSLPCFLEIFIVT